MRCSATLSPQGFLEYFHRPSCNRNGANGGASAPKGTADRHVVAAAAAADGVARWGEGCGVVTVVAVIMIKVVKNAAYIMFAVMMRNVVVANFVKACRVEVRVVNVCVDTAKCAP